MNKAVFLDRDGVINIDHGYVSKAAEFEFIEGVFEACRYLQSLGYLLIVVTNQSGIGRGYYTEQDFTDLTRWMLSEFNQNGVDITDVYFCPHHPKHALPMYQIECDCRKPEPGMLLNAIEKYKIDPKKSVMIGDKISDVQAGHAANIATTVLLQCGQALSAEATILADQILPSLADIITQDFLDK